MTGYRQLLEKEVIEAWRTYRLGITWAAAVILGIAVPVLTRALPDLEALFAGPDHEIGLADIGVPDIVDSIATTIVRFGAVVAILLAVASVAGERRSGTAALVLLRPVGRLAYVWAKFVALAMILGPAVGLAVLATWLYTSLLFGGLPALPWIQLALVLWLALLVPAAVTLLGSVIAPSPLGAAAIGLAFLVVVSLAALVPTLVPWLPAGLLDVARVAALEESSPDLDPPRTILVSIGFVVVALGLAWARLRRVDL